MRNKTGIVTSDKADKTITITVHTYKKHPKYKKKYRVSKKFYAHDPDNKYKVGDEVTIYEHRPLSKLKRWHVEQSETKKSAPNIQQTKSDTALAAEEQPEESEKTL